MEDRAPESECIDYVLDTEGSSVKLNVEQSVVFQFPEARNVPILKYFSHAMLTEVFQHVSQFDLVNLATCCSDFYEIANQRLYKRVTVILNASFPARYKGNRQRYVVENGMSYMDSTLIFSIENVFRFLLSVKKNLKNLQLVKYFVFDKCYSDNLLKLGVDISNIQRDIINFFAENCTELNFMHITFVDFVSGIDRLTFFLSHENIRNRIFKLFVTSMKDLYVPIVPPGLSNLFLMLDEMELQDIGSLDILNPPFEALGSLSTLTCSTNNQLGLEILKRIHISNSDDSNSKLKLKGLTIFHCHKEDLLSDEEYISTIRRRGAYSESTRNYIKQLDKTLKFDVLKSKIDLTYLTHLYLKIDCVENRMTSCKCFQTFFGDFALYSSKNDGLKNLTSLELELFPNIEWLRPHQILESILSPLGLFIKTLVSLSRLTIDFSTPAFKMFADSMGMSSMTLNKLNEKLIEAFLLCFFTSRQSCIIKNLKTLQLPDFLTSFIYYKPDFFESLLHVCDCDGCFLVLEKLRSSFFPLNDDDDDDDDDTDNEDWSEDQAGFYLLIGFVLGKLQTDREVCIPIKQKSHSFRNYPIYKGRPHVLHAHFHRRKKTCSCGVEEDPEGEEECNIDNLVTTYIVHQIRPVIEYVSSIFYNLENIMIHGIYYEFDKDRNKMVPVFDEENYPRRFLGTITEEQKRAKLDLHYGLFRATID